MPVSVSLQEINFLFIIGGWLFFILSIYNYKGYEYNLEFSRLREITSMVNAGSFMIIVSIILLFIFQIELPVFLTTLSRVIFAISLILLPILFRILIQNLISVKPDRESILVIGLGEMGKSFIDAQSLLTPSRFNLLGILDDNFEKGTQYNGYYVLGKIEELDSYLNNNNLKRIIVAVRHLSEEKIMYIESKAVIHGLALNFLPSIESFQNNPGKLKDHAGIPLISKKL